LKPTAGPSGGFGCNLPPRDRSAGLGCSFVRDLQVHAAGPPAQLRRRRGQRCGCYWPSYDARRHRAGGPRSGLSYARHALAHTDGDVRIHASAGHSYQKLGDAGCTVGSDAGCVRSNLRLKGSATHGLVMTVVEEPVGLKGNRLQKALSSPWPEATPCFAGFLGNRTTITRRNRQNLSSLSTFFAAIL